MDRPDVLFGVQELPLFGLELLHDLELRRRRLKTRVANG
jgi:hypothetical protein